MHKFYCSFVKSTSAHLSLLGILWAWRSFRVSRLRPILLKRCLSWWECRWTKVTRILQTFLFGNLFMSHTSTIFCYVGAAFQFVSLKYKNSAMYKMQYSLWCPSMFSKLSTIFQHKWRDSIQIKTVSMKIHFCYIYHMIQKKWKSILSKEEYIYMISSKYLTMYECRRLKQIAKFGRQKIIFVKLYIKNHKKARK